MESANMFPNNDRDELSQSEYYKTATVLLSAPTIAHLLKRWATQKKKKNAQSTN